MESNFLDAQKQNSSSPCHFLRLFFIESLTKASLRLRDPALWGHATSNNHFRTRPSLNLLRSSVAAPAVDVSVALALGPPPSLSVVWQRFCL